MQNLVLKRALIASAMRRAPKPFNRDKLIEEKGKIRTFVQAENPGHMVHRHLAASSEPKNICPGNGQPEQGSAAKTST
jgi:hypothetical protein